MCRSHVPPSCADVKPPQSRTAVIAVPRRSPVPQSQGRSPRTAGSAVNYCVNRRVFSTISTKRGGAAHAKPVSIAGKVDRKEPEEGVPSPPSKTVPKRPGSTRKLNNNLVALGTAAVVTVYAAGYVRTRSAAEAFAAEASQRRPPPQAPQVVESAEPSSSPVVQPLASTQADSPAATKSIKPATSASPKPAQPAPGDSSPAVAVPVDSVKVAVTDTTQAANQASNYKDGLYFGWGKSRHGDIQAAVEIKAGRIHSAFISECLTQYSCSWIVHLPPQMVARQSTDIDYVSGATHSANALYYALVDALAKAK